jgi:hypothetical protein
MKICLTHHDLIAQWLEYLPVKEKTMGSIPIAGCKFCNRYWALSSMYLIHPWFTRDSNPVPLGQKSGALTTELPGHLALLNRKDVRFILGWNFLNKTLSPNSYFEIRIGFRKSIRKGKNRNFVQICSTNVTIEQTWRENLLIF